MTHSSIRLPEIFQSHMMLQRDKPIRIWGDTTPDTRLCVQLLFQDRIISQILCQSDETGHFSGELLPQKAGELYSLIFSRSDDPADSITLSDLLIGDIYLAGGQSNMEFFLKYDKDYTAVKALPKNPQIRMYNVPQRAFEGHTSHNRHGYGYWFTDADAAVDTFSAPGYSFARHLQDALGIPIGIIGCNWGGSTASAWVPREVLTDDLSFYNEEYEAAIASTDAATLEKESLAAWEFEDSPEHGADFEPVMYGITHDEQLAYMQAHKDDPAVPMGPFNLNRPGGLYHTMLQNIIPFSLKGVLWYQGESDAGYRARFYDQLLGTLIKVWRNDWADELPFLIVQLAPFGRWLDCDSTDYTTVRAMQQALADQVTGVYLTGTMDIGSFYDIHPKEKLEVGRRLSLLALGHIYGKDLLCDCPRFASVRFTDDTTLCITFAHAIGLTMGDGLSTFLLSPTGEEEDAVMPERVCIKEDEIFLQLSKELASLIQAHPAATVSLGYADYSPIYIKNAAGLAALPFCEKINP